MTARKRYKIVLGAYFSPPSVPIFRAVGGRYGPAVSSCWLVVASAASKSQRIGHATGLAVSHCLHLRRRLRQSTDDVAFRGLALCHRVARVDRVSVARPDQVVTE